MKGHELLKVADDILHRMDENHDPSLELVIFAAEEEACRLMGVPCGDLGRDTRERHYTHGRYFMWLLLRSKGWPLLSAGRRYGRDHASVLNGLKRLREIEETKDKVYYPLLKEFKLKTGI